MRCARPRMCQPSEDLSIVVIRPYEDRGLRRYVEFTASPDQQLELRRFNFRLRRV
jgi:hypothetical protein